jgi:ribosomal protein S18 acetylase RimI-like enzyme
VAGRVEEGIDEAWLDRLYAADPAAHALSVWDRIAWPQLVEFRTLLEGGAPSAYLLIWKGLPECPVIHWAGEARDPEPLLATFPPRPFLAIVPPELAPSVAGRHPPTETYSLRLRRLTGIMPLPVAGRPTRRLGRADLPALRALAAEDGSTVTDTYLAIDLDYDWVVGGFDGSRLVAVARAEVRLPQVWHISGVCTLRSFRGRGWGRAVVGHLMRDASERKASVGLYVRDDNVPARRMYDRLGFEPGTPRAWVDAGAHRSP